MGGSLLSGKRINNEELQRLTSQLHELLIDVGVAKLHFVQSVREKVDHGDIDVLVDVDGFSVVVEWLTHSNIQHSRNGDVMSFLFKDVQIDVIKGKTESFEYHCMYLNNNDFGNLLGRIAHKLGLKHGHDGLRYVHRYNDSNQLFDRVITYDTNEIFDVLQLPRLHWNHQFNTFIEMFEYIKQSPWFSPKIYMLDNLTHKHRVRDRKRKTYNMFCDWCALQTDVTVEYPADRTEFVVSKYPQVQEWIDDAITEYENQRVYRQKMLDAANVVGNYSGKDLGKLIVLFKNISRCTWESPVSTFVTDMKRAVDAM